MKAKCRLADEYDAAQARGEVATRQHNPGSAGHVPGGNMPPATVADLGLTRKAIHEARQLRDAEAASPGMVRRTLDAQLERGQEPSKAAVRGAVAAGAVFPPLVVFEEEGRFWLAEGFHRLEAYTAAGIAEVPCDVRPGGLRDAILHSAGANPDHGVRRTSADKRRAVLTLLQDEEWGQWSDREIARRCAVSQPLVGRIRAEHLKIVSDSARLVERGGTTYSMKPRQRSAEPELEPSAPAEGEAQAEAPAEASPEAAEASADAEPSAALAPVIRLTQELAQQFRRESEHYREGKGLNLSPPRPFTRATIATGTAP